MTIHAWEQDTARSPQLGPGDVPKPPIPRLQVVTPPTIDLVTTAELADVLKVSQTEEGATLTGYLKSAESWCKAYTGRTFLETVLKLWVDYAPAERFLAIPGAPVSAISAVEYYADGTEVAATFAATNYIKDLISSPARLCLSTAGAWPQNLRPVNAMSVSYTAGYGATADLVPQGIRNAIKALAAEAYLCRGQQVQANEYELNKLAMKNADILIWLAPFKVVRS